MTGSLRLSKRLFRPRAGMDGLMSEAGRAGPRRLAIIGFTGVSVLGLMAFVTLRGPVKPIISQDARMKQVDALPGGLNSTPEQDALALQADRHRAQTALVHGVSFSPPMAPSVLAVGPAPKSEPAVPAAMPLANQPVPHFMGRPRFVSPRPLPIVLPVESPARPLQTATSTPPPVVHVEADSKSSEVYNKQIGALFSQWGNRYPRTDVVIPPTESNDDPSQTGQGNTRSSGGSHGSIVVSTRSGNELNSRVLIPAGRGIYAHPVLALSSDQSSPVVMQADSGPIAGDRMIGSFAKQDDRLVIHINSIIHDGQTISTDGVVIAPDTMEAGVATGVDQHYLARFVLPAAAAFVQGLGQALATTSNSVAVLSPLGGATTSTNLNFRQQLGVAAGVAGAQIGSTLNQAAPKGPTVRLEANVAVGVMFLSNVTVRNAG